MLAATQALIKSVGKKLNLTDAQIEQVLAVNAVHEFEIKLSNGQSYKAYRIQHNNKRGPYKGGIRFHPEVDKGEVQALATLMSLKTAAVNLPLGGGKGGVSVDPRKLSATELEELSRKYVQGLKDFIGPKKDVPAPDVNTDPRIIDWMVDEFSRLTGDKTRASFTGKSLKHGGSEGRDAATGRGGVIVLSELLKKQGTLEKPLTVAVQGFGNVGSWFAELAAKDFPQWQIVAVSDSRATLYDPKGLDVQRLVDFKKQDKHFSDFVGPQQLPSEALIEQPVDVLVLAALGDAVTNENQAKVKAKIILELANAPVNDKAITELEKRGTTIVPDILANAGGVIVSYLEWQQNMAGEHWTEDEVNKKLYDYLQKATTEIYERSQTAKVGLKEAALTVAMERLLS